ncbi:MULTISPECIES: hypothetical protein [unclassified Microbacterium]|uniref:hypothetical protein n=1 Tax=unclassified Microbacterium TaxID=2609290 RepID=UPI00109D1959|nr:MULTISPECIES: hypothetical protein [unclassified Microbacterium]
MNLPYKIGDRYLCFTVTKRDRGWGGPYGQYRREVEWTCDTCGFKITGDGAWSMKHMADHHECGHAPCDRCGTLLLRRKDGTPRQHAHNRCPKKSPGHKIEREFVKNMSIREMA